MDFNAWIAIVIFVITYIFIVAEYLHRTIVVLTGAMVILVAGILSQERALQYIDFNTIGLLSGMMIIINITGETGLFNYLSIWAAKKAKGDPVRILVALSVLTAVCSAFLDNVTTVLLTVPITLRITSQLKMTPKPFLIAQILSSNIGGAATLIGDPPNVMIGSAVKELDFTAFIVNLSGVCAVIFVVTMLALVLLFRKSLCTTEALKEKVLQLDQTSEITNALLLKKCLLTLGLTILMFIFHGQLHLESATVAMAGAVFLMLIAIPRNEALLIKSLSKIEWVAIFFFIGLFTLVGALVETGVIRLLAEEAMRLTEGHLLTTTMLILWISAVTSAFVDNIPLVATMIPLIKDMGAMGIVDLEPLWWSLSLGACLGGNGTLIGASANVVVACIAAQAGYKISFVKYMKIALPLMFLSIGICSIYMYVFYL